MNIEKSNDRAIHITTSSGLVVSIRETATGRLTINIPNDRIMYKTDQGINNADYVEIIK